MDSRLIRAEGSPVIPDSFHAVEDTCEVFSLSLVRKESYILPSGFLRHIHILGALGISSGFRRA